MASYPEHDDERFDAEPASPPPKRGMSTGWKVVIILLCVGGGLMLLCCGGCVYFVMKIRNGISDDPKVAAEVAKDVVDMEIPPAFQPKASFVLDFPSFTQVPKMKMVFFTTADNRGTMMLMEIISPDAQPGEMNEAQGKQFQDQMKQQGHGNRELDIEKSGTKEIMIRGKKTSVRFSTGVDPDTKAKYRQVSTSFKGKRENSVVIIQLQLPEKDYKEDEILKMLNSIK